MVAFLFVLFSFVLSNGLRSPAKQGQIVELFAFKNT
jgi:hypothetical protein